jgi:methylenetetrahydrofolate dehydrogenase (NADP+)/methenyltetrahydrofolate cyclohydrolase
MAVIFDGKAFAVEKEEALKMRVLGLKTRGVNPKLASILIGSDPASKLYVGLKKKAAERIGAELDVYYIPENSKIEDVLLLISTLNLDDTVNGIMVQMPLPEKLEKFRDRIVNLISSEKDVDGLKHDSHYLHPTSKAVIDILKEAEKDQKTVFKKICVVGAFGMVGAPLVKELNEKGYKVTGCGSKTSDIKSKTLEADVVVSATGVQGLISGEMVKDGAVVIDVGSPRGDVNFYEVERKASFITPVPGGVGPVTISCLLENLISAS